MATTMDISSNPLAKFSLRTRQNTILHTGYMGTIKYMLQTLIFEEYSTGLHAQIGVFEGQRVDVNTNEEVDCIIKVRMQLNPVLIPHVSSSSRASYFLDRECRALRAAQYSGRTPDFIACASEVQDRSGFYPGGYLDIIAMSKLPGKPIAQCLGALTAADLKVIKKDLAVLLKYMDQIGYSLPLDASTNPSEENGNRDRSGLQGRLARWVIDDNHVSYDQASKSVYLSDLSRFGFYGETFGGAQHEEIIARSEFWQKLVALNQLKRLGLDNSSGVRGEEGAFTLCSRDRNRAVDRDPWPVRERDLIDA